MKKAKGIDGKLDKYWSLVVRERANNKCQIENCTFSQKQVHAHHIFSRANKSVRWDPDNGISLCPGHHVYSSKFSAHQTPTDFTYYLEQRLGRDFLDKLSYNAHQIAKWSDDEKQTMLDALISEHKSLLKKK
jgi:hypothetical protein